MMRRRMRATEPAPPAPRPPAAFRSARFCATHQRHGYRLGYVARTDDLHYAIWEPGSGLMLHFPFTDDGWLEAWTTFHGLEPANKRRSFRLG